MGGIAQITSSLFLGRASVTSNWHLLQVHGITCVVNATIENPNFNWPQFEYVRVPLGDIPRAPIRLYFNLVTDKMHSVSKKCEPLSHPLHCLPDEIPEFVPVGGIQLGESPEACNQAQPRFLEQLIDYKSELFGKSTVKMVQTPNGITADVYEKASQHLIPYWGI